MNGSEFFAGTDSVEQTRDGISPIVTPPRAGAVPLGGVPVVRKFPFTFDTPDLATGATVYTPTVGDTLLDVWLEVDTAWDGATPLCDVGQFSDSANGWYAVVGVTIDMTAADQLGNALLYSPTSLDVIAQGVKAGYRIMPGKVTTAAPVKVVVSQDGTPSGGDPGSTHGAATLYLVTASATVAAPPAPAGGGYPIADARGVSVDSTSYPNTVTNDASDKLTTLVFPRDTGALAIAIEGDAYPRWLLASDPTDGIFMGDGTFDPYYGEGYASLEWARDALVSQGPFRTGGVTSPGHVAPLWWTSPRLTITAGQLPSVEVEAGVPVQPNISRDVEVYLEVGFASAGGVVVMLSPDNESFTALATIRGSSGSSMQNVRVPAGWWLMVICSGGGSVAGAASYA